MEKKVTEGPSRVGIIVRVLDNQGTDRSTHRIWPSEALVLMDPRGYLRGCADGSSCEAIVRAPSTGLRKNYPRFFCLGASCQKTPGDQTKDAGLRRLSRALYCRHIAVSASPCPIWGGSPMWVTLRDQIWSKI